MLCRICDSVSQGQRIGQGGSSRSCGSASGVGPTCTRNPFSSDVLLRSASCSVCHGASVCLELSMKLLLPLSLAQVSSPALAPASAAGLCTAFVFMVCIECYLCLYINQPMHQPMQVTSLEVPAATTPAAVTCDTNALQQACCNSSFVVCVASDLFAGSSLHVACSSCFHPSCLFR